MRLTIHLRRVPFPVAHRHIDRESAGDIRSFLHELQRFHRNHHMQTDAPALAVRDRRLVRERDPEIVRQLRGGVIRDDRFLNLRILCCRTTGVSVADVQAWLRHPHVELRQIPFRIECLRVREHVVRVEIIDDVADRRSAVAEE